MKFVPRGAVEGPAVCALCDDGTGMRALGHKWPLAVNFLNSSRGAPCWCPRSRFVLQTMSFSCLSKGSTLHVMHVMSLRRVASFELIPDKYENISSVGVQHPEVLIGVAQLPEAS